MKPLAWASFALALGSALFEPMRGSLYSLGEAVSGVGGVGGLANEWDPKECGGRSEASRGEFYCFHRGVLFGITPFAWVVMLCCTVPLIAAGSFAGILGPFFASRRLCGGLAAGSAVEPPAAAEPQAEAGWPPARTAFLAAWSGLSILWFVVPASAYLSSSFYQKDAYSVILAIALTAAFPLSWHAAFVVLPAADVFAAMIGLSRRDALLCHKLIAKHMCFWAAIHAAGELIYFVSQGQLLSTFNVAASGENLLYVFGLALLLLLALQASVAAARRRVAQFRSLHRAGAGLLLLVASCHWWPFAFFLLPAVAVHATEAAFRGRSRLPSSQHLHQAYGAALAAAAVAAVAATAMLWSLRQRYMARSDAGLALPYCFPPLGLLAGYLLAWAAAASVSCCWPRLAGCMPEAVLLAAPSSPAAQSDAGDC